METQQTLWDIFLYHAIRSYSDDRRTAEMYVSRELSIASLEHGAEVIARGWPVEQLPQLLAAARDVGCREAWGEDFVASDPAYTAFRERVAEEWSRPCRPLPTALLMRMEVRRVSSRELSRAINEFIKSLTPEDFGVHTPVRFGDDPE